MNSNTEEFNSRSEESTLSTGDETLCTYGSIFGVLISCTGLLQLFLYARFHWITMLLTGLYGFGIAAYVSLGLQKGASVYLVYANIIITLIIYIIYTRDGIWSLIVIVLCAYNAVIASISLVEGLSKKLRDKSRYLKQENKYWEERL